MILFEFSIWLSVLLDRRSRSASTAAARDVTARLRRLGAPGRRPAAPGRARRLGGRPHRRGRPGPRRAPLRGRGDPARASSTRTRTSSTRSTPASATAGRSATGSALHIARKRALAHRGHGGDRTARRGRLARRRASRRRPTTASPAPSAAAATELGLRAIVYLEVFGSDPERRAPPVRGDARSRATGDASSSRSASRRTRPTPCSLERLRLVPVARHPGRDAPRRERGRERVARRSGTGPLARDRRAARRADAASAPSRRSPTCSAPSFSARTASTSTTTRSRCSPTTTSPVAHCPRSNALLGCGIAPLAALRAAGRPRRARHRLARLDAVVRRLGGAAHRRLHEPRPRTAPDALDADDALRLATLDAARALGARRRGRKPDAREARRPNGRFRSPEARTIRSRTRQSQPFSAAHRQASWRRSSTDRPVTAKERPRGKRYAAPQAPPDGECWRSASPRRRRSARSRSTTSWEDQLFFSRLRVHAKWVFVFLAVVFALQLRPLRRRLRLDRDRRRPQNFFNGILERAGGSSLSSLQKKAAENPKDAKVWRELATALEQKDKTEQRDRRARPLHRAEAEGRERAPGARRALPAPRRRLRPAVRRGAVEGRRSSRRAPSSSRQRPRRSRRRFAGPDLDRRSRPSTSDDHDATPTRSTSTTQSKAVDVYKQLVKLNPKDATNQYRLAQVAQAAGQHGRRDRGLQDVPQARAERFARTGREEGAEGADGSLNGHGDRWLDSPAVPAATGSTPAEIASDTGLRSSRPCLRHLSRRSPRSPRVCAHRSSSSPWRSPRRRRLRRSRAHDADRRRPVGRQGALQASTAALPHAAERRRPRASIGPNLDDAFGIVRSPGLRRVDDPRRRARPDRLPRDRDRARAAPACRRTSSRARTPTTSPSTSRECAGVPPATADVRPPSDAAP